MSNPLSLEERTVGHLLRNVHSGFDFFKSGDGSLLENIENDSIVIQDYLDGDIPPNHDSLVDVRRRNPFLEFNFYIPSREVLIRAIKIGSYDVKSAILSVISDPHGIGRARAYYIAHDIGDGRQLAFVFFHELGINLGIQNQVEEEVRAYTEAYKDHWTGDIRSRGRLAIPLEKEQEILAYQTCLTPKFKASRPFLERDRTIIAILSTLTAEKLEEYFKQYFKVTSAASN